jgi:hypothetical protein
MSGAHVERQNAQFQVPLSAITLTGSGGAYTRDAQGQFSISLPTASTTYRLGIPLGSVMPWVVSANANIDRFGFKLEQIALWYSIGSVDLTAHTITLNTEAIAGAASRAASTTLGGALTYDTDDGTSAALATVQRANLYKTRVILGTPTYLLTQHQLPVAEWSLATGASSGTAKVHGVVLVGRFGLYY